METGLAAAAVKDGHAFQLRHQNVACSECATGLHMVLVAVDPVLRRATHTEGILVECGCRRPLTPERTARIEAIAMRQLDASLRRAGAFN